MVTLRTMKICNLQANFQKMENLVSKPYGSFNTVVRSTLMLPSLQTTRVKSPLRSCTGFLPVKSSTFAVSCLAQPSGLARLLRVRGYENGFRNGRFGVRNGRVGVRNGRVGVRNGRFGVRNGRFGVRNGRFGDRNGRFGFRMGTKTIGYENDGKWRAKVFHKKAKTTKKIVLN